MDIFKNWREGKKKHDELVDKDLVEKFYQTLLPPPDINTASILIREISELRRRKEIDKESLLWKTLGDYALGMADIQSKDSIGTNVTIEGSDLAIAINRANKRRDTHYGQTQVVNSPTNARVKRQDPLKEELRERRENGIKNEAGV